MANTGNIFPGTGEGNTDIGDTAWTNPGNIVSDNATDATCSTATTSQYLVARNFNFRTGGGAVPTNATISGVTVRIEASEHTAGTEVLNGRLQNETGALIGSGKSSTISGTTKAVYTQGSTADLWGATITPTIVHDADFGVRFWFNTAHDVRVDYVTMALEFTVPSPGIATSTNTALALTLVKLKATGMASESDTALACVVENVASAIEVPTGRADETDSAQAPTPIVKIRLTSAGLETNAAIALAVTKIRATGMATETDAALDLGRSKIVAITAALETDEALAPAIRVLTVLYIATGTALETDAALTDDPPWMKIVAVAISEETSEAPTWPSGPGFVMTSYYPGIGSSDAVQEIDPWDGSPLAVPEVAYRQSSRGVRVCGEPYMAAASDTLPNFGNGGEFAISLTFVLHALPVMLADPDEVHQLLSFHEPSTLRELYTIGITPSGKIATDNWLLGALRTPIVLSPGSRIYSVGVQFYGNTNRHISLDGSVLVSQSLPEPGEYPYGAGGDALGRVMLFNGLDGKTRCELTVVSAGLGNENSNIRWPINEGSGGTLWDEEYVTTNPSTGAQAWDRRDSDFDFALFNDFGPSSWKLSLQWYDPGVLGLPRLYGSVPSSDPASCYRWSRRVPYTVRGPVGSTFVPVGAP